MTRDPFEISDQSRVKLSIVQLWSIIGSVAAATFFVVNGLLDIRNEQKMVRSELSVYRVAVDTQFIVTNTALQNMRDEQREWTAWRRELEQVNVRRDAERASLLRAIEFNRSIKQ